MLTSLNHMHALQKIIVMQCVHVTEFSDESTSGNSSRIAKGLEHTLTAQHVKSNLLTTQAKNKICQEN